MKLLLSQRRAFTLMEIMIVVGIIGVILTMSIPAITRVLNKESLRQAVDDVVEACSHARAQAILSGSPVDVVFTAEDARISVGGAGGGDAGEPDGTGAGVSRRRSAGGFNATISEEIGIAMLDVNLQDFMEADQARVRFYPNGTCDEFTIILQSNKGELRKITLEVTTGLPDVERDPRRF